MSDQQAEEDEMQATITKTAHSVGPWRLCKISDRLYGVNDAGGVAVADLHAIQGNKTAANARLIAAAPGMLAALQAIILDSDKLPENQFRLAAVAIAKATGDV